MKTSAARPRISSGGWDASRRIRGLLAGLALFAANSVFAPVFAGEVLHSRVDYEDGHYLLDMAMRIDAPLPRVREVLTDYANIAAINPTVVESTVLAHAPPNYRVRVVTEGCVWFFCKTLTQIQQVTELASGYIVIVLDTREGDFTYGRILWHIQADEDRTRVSFSGDLVPDFWVPPLIGPWLLSGVLEEETRKTVEGLERLASRRNGQPPDDESAALPSTPAAVVRP